MSISVNTMLLLLASLFGSLESSAYYSYRSYRYYSYRYYSYRYYRYSYYSYRSYYYTYYYYNGYVSGQGGIIAGSVIGVLIGIFLFTACVMYFCIYRRRVSTSRTFISTGPIATITSPTQPSHVVSPDHRIVYTPDGPVYKAEEGMSQPPPSYEESVPASSADSLPPKYEQPIDGPATMTVDSTSTVNLVHNEVSHTV